MQILNQLKVDCASSIALLLAGAQLGCSTTAPAKREGASLVVTSRHRAVDTGVDVQRGETLVFTTPDGATWKDSMIKRAADGSGKSELFVWYMGLWRKCLAAPDSPAFSLNGRVGTSNPFFIGKGARIAMPEAGRLMLFVNDVPGFYWNNFGAIAVKFTKVKGGGK